MPNELKTREGQHSAALAGEAYHAGYDARRSLLPCGDAGKQGDIVLQLAWLTGWIARDVEGRDSAAGRNG